MSEEERVVRGYALIEPLGRSPERTTWRARRLADGAPVVVKELLFHAMQSWKTAELFEREARVLRQLAHPRVPELLDAFVIEEGARGGLYIVRELVAGRSLAEEMRERAHAPREVAAIAAELCAIVADLHALSPPVVHRDLTPANVLRRDDGALVVIDLGAVKDALAPGGSTIAGTYGFMAPEQLRGEAAPASDVYAIGAIALSLCARRPIAELLDARHRLTLDDHVPRGALRRAIASMLAPSAAARPTARQAQRALEGIARGERGARGAVASVGVALAIGAVVALAATRVDRPADVAAPSIAPPAFAPTTVPSPDTVAPPRTLSPAPPIEHVEPPELEGWSPRCASRGCAPVAASFAGITLDDACGPLLPDVGPAPIRSERADTIELDLDGRRVSCRASQQHGAFCNVLCEIASEEPSALADELRAWIGDRHGVPDDADEHVSGTSLGALGLPPSEQRRRTWTWGGGDDPFAASVLLLADRSSDTGQGRVSVSYRGRFQRRRS